MKRILSKHYWADLDIQQLIGQLLRLGVVTASSIVFAGGLIYLYRHGQESVPHYQNFAGEDGGYTTITQIIKGIGLFKGKGIIQFGVLVLIATPILRIFFSLIGFAIEKDKLYVIITSVVFTVIMFSLLGGLKL
ncbi:MAG TPA: DUF1634 domain-containing protein [Flavisolibacter sp.]|nr:DUF1634 domain-containing protein [Flavisolibacter sp.]